MKSLLILASLLSFATTAQAISIEDYYKEFGYNLTPEQQITMNQDIKLVHFLDSVLPEGTQEEGGFFIEIQGVDEDGNSCILSRLVNKSEMMYRHGENNSDYRFSWDATDMTNIMGRPIKTNFALTSNSAEASATIPLGYGLARINMKIKVLKDKSVSVTLRDRSSLFPSNKTCIFK